MAVLAIGCLGGALFLICFIYGSKQPTAREAVLLNVLLFVLSSVASIIIGYYFAKMTNSEKVDTIAERSTEKMVHLSLQLHSLKEYLEETEDVADDEHNIYAGMNAYRHRTGAAAHQASSLASSNEAFRGDWLGVVTEATKTRIENRFEALRTFMQDYETIQKLHMQKGFSSIATEDKNAAERLMAAEKRIESIQHTLPVQPPVFRRVAGPPAVEVCQSPSDASATRNSGIITIKVLRPVFAVTGSGKLSPPMPSIPWITAKLVQAPQDLNWDGVRVSPGTGTGFDFNIALKSTIYGTHLPVGEYKLEYTASVQENVDRRSADEQTNGGAVGVDLPPSALG